MNIEYICSHILKMIQSPVRIYNSNKILEKTTIDKDVKFFKSNDFSQTYYNSEALELIKKKLDEDRG